MSSHESRSQAPSIAKQSSTAANIARTRVLVLVSSWASGLSSSLALHVKHLHLRPSSRTDPHWGKDSKLSI
jgi:hypothetical protein